LFSKRRLDFDIRLQLRYKALADTATMACGVAEYGFVTPRRSDMKSCCTQPSTQPPVTSSYLEEEEEEEFIFRTKTKHKDE